jgi:hypothetical protein
MSRRPIRKTTAASAAIGRYASGPVANSRTQTTTALAVSWASWLRPPALSTICVCVAPPLTTNALVNAAATLAAPRPTRSLSELVVSLCLAA